VHCTKHVRVYVSAQEGIDLDLAILRIHFKIYSYVHLWKASKKYTIIVLVW
jgi:hypothetical protein